jgi:hypothetical protein
MDLAPTLLPIQQQLQRQSQAMSPQPQSQAQPAGYNNGTVPGGLASMVKALTDGMKERQARAAQGAQAAQGTQPMATGLPGVAVPMTPNAIPNSPGSQASLPGMPNGVDPSIQALFSPVPGQGGFSGG